MIRQGASRQAGADRLRMAVAREIERLIDLYDDGEDVDNACNTKELGQAIAARVFQMIALKTAR